MLKNAVLVAGLLFVGACWSSSDQGAQTVAKVPPSAAKVAVEMTAATLADDCGGTAPTSPPATIHKTEKADKATETKEKSKSAKGRRRCEQTSMQLSVIAPAGVPATTIKVKKVELYDADSGKLIGALTASSPTMWVDANGRYEAWNQSVAPDAKLSVSYVLSQPDWSGVKDKNSRAYTLKAVLTIGSADHTVSHEAEVAAPTIMPPNVKT